MNAQLSAFEVTTREREMVDKWVARLAFYSLETQARMFEEAKVPTRLLALVVARRFPDCKLVVRDDVAAKRDSFIMEDRVEAF